MKPLVYLGTPYCYRPKSKEIGINKPDTKEKDRQIREERFEKVSEVAAKLFNSGFDVFSPISMSHPIAKYMENAGQFDVWEEFDYRMILLSHMLFVLCVNGWKDSDGVAKEINFAKEQGIPVIYITEDLQILEG
jgi:nucleoside 2-deoxyribosyltransferase